LRQVRHEGAAIVTEFHHGLSPQKCIGHISLKTNRVCNHIANKECKQRVQTHSEQREKTHIANLTAAFKINLGAEALIALAMIMEEKAQSNKRLCAWLSDPEDPKKKPANDSASVVSTAVPASVFEEPGCAMQSITSSQVTSTTLQMAQLNDEEEAPLNDEEEAQEDADCMSLRKLMLDKDGLIKLDVASVDDTNCDADQKLGGVTEPLTEASLKLLEDTLAGRAIENAQASSFDRSNLTAAQASRCALFEKAERDNHVDPRGHLGCLFRAEHKKGSLAGDEYAKLSREQGQAFRVKWASLSFREWKEQKTQTKSWRRVDSDKGRYLNLDQLILDQGTSRAAMEGTAKLVAKATTMGTPWIRVHPQTERVLYLVLGYEFEEQFDQCWTHYKCEHEHAELVDNAIGVEGQQALGAAADAGQPKPKGKAKAKAHAANAPLAALDNQPPRQAAKPKAAGKAKSKFTQMWADGAKMKASLSNTTKAAMDILEQIQLSKDWEFAKNPQNKGVLDQLLTDLKSKLSDFHRSFLIEEASQIKKQYGEDFLIKELEVLVSLKPDVAKVQDFVDKLRKRKNA
jgi:hypothetical protein